MAKDLNLAKIETLRPSGLQVSLLTPQDDGAKNEHNNKMKINSPILFKSNTLGKMNSSMSSIRLIIFVFLAFVLTFTSYFKFYHHHLNIPNGCDEFGYLYLADAISKKVTFNDHSKREFSARLIDYLEKKGAPFSEFAWTIAPHAYHVEKNTKKIINQYPPGISFLLSLFPKENRQVYFPVVSTFLFAFLPLSVFLLLKGGDISLTSGMSLVVLFVLSSFVSSPLMQEFHRVNSIAPTYGFLLAAGISLKRRPEFSLFLIGMSVVFRIPNIILSVPILVYFMVIKLQKDQYIPFTILKNMFKGLIILSCSGVLVYFIYAFLLLGNPFYPTYSTIDQEVVKANALISNIRYYFDFNKSWFVFNIAAIIGIGILRIFKRIENIYFFTLVSIPIVNYVFFITHNVKIEYYPYASSIFLFGALIFEIATINLFKKEKTVRILIPFLAIVIAFVFIKGIKDHQEIHKKRYESQMSEIKHCFSSYDVVWAELGSSTIEYATGKAGYRYNWGNNETKMLIIDWLWRNKYHQAFWLDDIGVKNAEIISNLNVLGIEHQIVSCGRFGRIVVADAKN